MTALRRRSRWHLRAVWAVGMLALFGMLQAGCLAPNAASTVEPTASPVAVSTSAVAATAVTTATPVPFKALKISPEQGRVGTEISITGEGLPAGKSVEFLWGTVDGSYDVKASEETIEYYDRKFTPKRVSWGNGKTDDKGNISTTLKVPEDYGEIHDIFAVVDGQVVGKGGFVIKRNVTLSTLEGPVGAPITIEVKGLGWTAFSNTMAVLYDNVYVGFITAVTTRGTARAQIRAAGPVGKHVIRVTNSSAAVPYLNLQQSPVKANGEFRFDFTVTEDAGAPEPTLDWPDASLVATNPITRTASSNTPAAPGVSASFTPPSGEILSDTTLKASGLPADASVNLLWVSAKGNRLSPSGWNLTTTSLGKATVGKDGSLSASVKIPDDLGGWHTVKIVQGETVLAEAPYYVVRSLVVVAPAKVKAGESFQVQVKGVGWTELDNTLTVSYDNSYMGYACGFNSQGDVTLNLVAYGQPGTHLIDLYPTIFLGHGKGPWDYDLPQLSFAQDHPGLALGYQLPAFRLAITVVAD